jgi:hypothetical protein
MREEERAERWKKSQETQTTDKGTGAKPPRPPRPPTIPSISNLPPLYLVTRFPGECWLLFFERMFQFSVLNNIPAIVLGFAGILKDVGSE